MPRILLITIALGLMAVLLPAIALRSEPTLEDTKRETTEAVVRLAGSNPSSFRTVLSRMDRDEKRHLMNVLKEALVENNKVEVEVDAQPTISLTLDFGSVE